MSEDPEQGKSGPGQSSQNASPKGTSPIQPAQSPRRASLWHRHSLLLLWLGAMALLLLLGVARIVRYVQSPQFNERVRQYAIERIEQASGGRVEIERLSWNWRRLELELYGLQIHGMEAAGEAPLLRVEWARARLNWEELLTGQLNLRELRVLRPMVHVDVYRDGSTNFPEAKAHQAAGTKTEEVLRMAVDEAELVDGQLDWNDAKVRLDGAASGVYVELGYQAAGHHYEGKARVGQVRMRMPQLEPLTLAAEAEFRLYHDRVEVQRLRVNEGHGWVVEASGAVSGLASPVAQFTYRAAGDAARLARLVHYRELQSGAVQLSGEGTYRWDRGEYAAVGTAQAAGVSWANEILQLGKINGGFAYSLSGSSQTLNHFNASSIFATALGGTVHGKLDATHLPGKEAVGQIDLQVTSVELERVLRAFSTRELPLERLPLDGLTGGTLQVNWRGSPLNARMDGNLRVQPVSRAGELPVTATVQASVDFKDGAVLVHSVEASAPETHLSAQGRLAANSNLNLEVETGELSELAPMVSSWRGSRAKDLPIEFGGRAVFRGTVQGRLESPALAGYLELHDFVTVVRMPAWRASGMVAGAGRVVRTRWDLLQGDIHYSAIAESLRNGILRRGGTKIALDASVELLNGSYDLQLPFAVRVKVDNAGIGELQTLLGTTLPVTGRVSGELEATGTTDHLNGSGHVAVKDGTAWRQAVRLATAELNLTENQVQVRNIVLKSDAMQLTGDARINVETSEFGFNLKGTEVKLESLHALSEGRVHVSGRAAFEASGEGTPAEPVFNGRLRLRNLSVGGQALGGLDVEAVTHGELLNLTVSSTLRSTEAKLDGEIHLRGQMPMSLSGDLHSTKLNSLLDAYLPVRLEDPSELKMHLDARGEALRFGNMTAQLVVDRFATTYGGITVSNDGAIRANLANGVVHVDQFRLSGERGTRFLQVQGYVPLSGKREINLRADGNVNLKLLETINPNLTADGAANLDLQITGTLAQPSMHGRLNVQDASLSYVDFPNGLSGINGTLVFNEDRLQLQELTARTGGGLLHCAGFITYSPSLGLGFNLSAGGRGIRLRYPEGLSSTADASLLLSGSLKNALLSGTVTITRLGVNSQFNIANYLAKGVHGAPALKSDSPLNGVHVDVRVISTPELQVQTSLARLSGNVDLRLRGTAFRPVVLGRVDLLEGTLDLNGTKYRMERGDIAFTNAVQTYPTIDVEMSARVRDYDLMLGFHGPLDKLTTTYRSDPPLSSSDIVSLLALGRTAEESANPAMMGTSQYHPAVSTSSSTELLGQALSTAQSSRVQKLFGVSRVKIDPNAGEAVNSGLARVTVEQQISNKLTLTYISNLNQSAQEIIQFEYNVGKGVSVVGVRDQTGVVSFDVVFRKRRK